MTHVYTRAYTTICIPSQYIKYCWEKKIPIEHSTSYWSDSGYNLSGHFRYWKILTANLFRSLTRLELIPTTDLKTVSATMVQATRPELRLVLATPVRTASFMLRRPPMELRRRPSCSCSFRGTSLYWFFIFCPKYLNLNLNKWYTVHPKKYHYRFLQLGGISKKNNYVTMCM